VAQDPSSKTAEAQWREIWRYFRFFSHLRGVAGGKGTRRARSGGSRSGRAGAAGGRSTWSCCRPATTDRRSFA